MGESAQFCEIKMKSPRNIETDKYVILDDDDVDYINNDIEKKVMLMKNEDVPSLDHTDRDSFMSSFSSDAQHDECLTVDNVDKYCVDSPSPISKTGDNDITFTYEPYSSSFFNDYMDQETYEQISSMDCEKKMERNWYDPFFNFLDSICTTANNGNKNNKHSIKEMERRYLCHEIYGVPHDNSLQLENNCNKKNQMNIIQKYSKKRLLKKKFPRNRSSRQRDEYKIISLGGSKSMNDEYISKYYKSNMNKQNSFSPLSPSASKPSLLSTVMYNCVSPESDLSQEFNDMRDDLSEVCYDSDPGEFTYRRSIALNWNNTEQEESQIFDDSVIDFYDNVMSQSNLNQNTDQSIDTLAPYIVKASMNVTKMLVLHQPQQKNKPTIPPMKIKMWIERGAILQNTVIEPRMMWTITNNMNKKSLNKPFCIPLMDIHRITSVSTIDREAFPFAKTKFSFIISSSSHGKFLFEARNEKQKNILVRNMKLIIARLASQAFLNNSDILRDYFQDTTSMLDNYET